MGLTKRKDGYYVEFRVFDDGKTETLGRGEPGEKLKRWKTHTFNKTLAKQQEAIIKTDLMKGIVKSKRNPPVLFAAWAETYLALEGVRSLSTYQDRVETVRLQLIPFFGKKPLGEIAPSDVEAFRAQRRLRNGEAPAVATVNADHAALKHMLSLAVKRKLLMVNVAKDVEIPNPHNERDRVLTPDEWGRLYTAAPVHLKAVLLLAYEIGPRLSEILRLTWDRVDMQGGFIKLRSTDTKTREPRLVPLTPNVLVHLRELAKVRSLTSNHVFRYKEKPMLRIKTAFHTAIREAGIEDFRFHDLRHCAATNLRRAGVDTITAMRIVGHKSERMHKRYNTVGGTDLKEAVAKLNTYLTPACSPLETLTVSA